MSPDPRPGAPTTRTQRSRALVAAVGVAATAAGTCLLVAGPTAPAGAATFSSVGTSFSVALKGNGHGHGLSQYGAEGAALHGLSYRRILHFYYPHTRLQTGTAFRISVLLSGTGAAPTVLAQPGLHVTGVGHALATRRVTRYRLSADARGGLELDALRGGTWTTFRRGLPARTTFHRKGSVRVVQGGGTTAYHGTVAGLRQSGSNHVLTINRLPIDDYVAGVVPREMPSSWKTAAVQAQAVAARTYARYEADHATGPYDICDTTSCQVYGGAAHYARNGALLWTEDRAAVTGDRNQYLTYHGAAIFAQFSASNGGWTVDGGQPYLVAKRDPYDDGASGDPYLQYTTQVQSSTIAAYFGLSRVSSIAIMHRDGHGSWGGRVTSARITGIDPSGHRTTVHTDGSDLQWAMGVGTAWLRLVTNHRPQGHLKRVRVHHGRIRVIGWAIDADHASHSPPMRIRIDGHVAARFKTHTARPRIVRHFGLHYRRPGFRRVFDPSSGRHRVCAYARDTNGLRGVKLGCVVVHLRH